MYIDGSVDISLSIKYVLLVKVMMIHAGGYSQRLPNQSVLGKVFLTLPCGKNVFRCSMYM